MLITKIFNNIHRKIVKTRLHYKERLLDGGIQQEFFWSHPPTPHPRKTNANETKTEQEPCYM